MVVSRNTRRDNQNKKLRQKSQVRWYDRHTIRALEYIFGLHFHLKDGRYKIVRVEPQ